MNPDFAKLARVQDPADLPAAVDELLAAPGPVLLDVVVEPDALALPPHVSSGMAEEFSLSL